jgi:hypothetical protein
VARKVIYDQRRINERLISNAGDIGGIKQKKRPAIFVENFKNGGIPKILSKDTDLGNAIDKITR